MSTSKVPLISVVDDDRSVVEATVSLLESVGYSSLGFFSAEEFLNSPHLRNTACLILDLRMPGLDGLGLQQRMTAENVRMPIIFITANGEEQVLAAMKGGAVAVLRKPFNQESLLGALRSALAKPVCPSSDRIQANSGCGQQAVS